MKSTIIKYPAMIAMAVSLVSFSLVIAALVASYTEPQVNEGVSKSFSLWVFGTIVAYFSLIFYFIDAIFSIIKVFMKIHPLFNAILSVMLILSIPMGVLVGSGLGINIYIWNAYYLTIFVLEIISIIKHVKINSPRKDGI